MKKIIPINTIVLLLLCLLFNPIIVRAGGEEVTPTPTPASAPQPSSSSGNSSTPQNLTPVCGDTVPHKAPDLFQINVGKNSATLYFVPTKIASYYYIAYGTAKNKQQYGVQFNLSDPNGVKNFKVNALKSGTRYYFEIRGGNGCMPGDWSRQMSIVTTGSKSAKKIYYAYNKGK